MRHVITNSPDHMNDADGRENMTARQYDLPVVRGKARADEITAAVLADVDPRSHVNVVREREPSPRPNTRHGRPSARLDARTVLAHFGNVGAQGNPEQARNIDRGHVARACSRCWFVRLDVGAGDAHRQRSRLRCETCD